MLIYFYNNIEIIKNQAIIKIKKGSDIKSEPVIA